MADVSPGPHDPAHISPGAIRLVRRRAVDIALSNAAAPEAGRRDQQEIRTDMADATSAPVDLARLTAKFPPEAIKSRELPGSGKRAQYVEGHVVIHRLNDATGNNWTFVVDDMSKQPAAPTSKGIEQMLWICRGTLTIPGHGTRAGIGVQTVNEKTEDLIKGALTDCLKACAKNFGVALELYGPDYEDDGERVDRHTGEITAPARPAAPVRTEQAPRKSPRDVAAQTLWDIAKAKTLTRDQLEAFAVDTVNLTLEHCQLDELVKVMNKLKAITDIDQLKDFLNNPPPMPGMQAPLVAAGAPTPLRDPARFTN